MSAERSGVTASINSGSKYKKEKGRWPRYN